MKLTRVIIDYYKKFKNAKIELNDKATVFIGQNDSGKSPLLNGIYKAISERSPFHGHNFYSKILKKDAVIPLLSLLHNSRLT